MNVKIAAPAAGVATITNTTAWTAAAGTYASHVQILTDAVIASATDAAEKNSGSLATLSLKAGTIIEGHFTAITLTSGAVRLLLAKA